MAPILSNAFKHNIAISFSWTENVCSNNSQFWIDWTDWLYSGPIFKIDLKTSGIRSGWFDEIFSAASGEGGGCSYATVAGLKYILCSVFPSGPVKFKIRLGSYLTQKVSDAGLCRSGPSSPPPLFKMWFWRVSDVELGRSGLSSPSPPPPPPPTLGFASKTWSRHWKWLLQGFSLQSWKCELPLSFALTRRQYVCRL